jgi:hypothetical protein
MVVGQTQRCLGCEDMRNFLTGDDRRAQRRSRGSALKSMALPMFGGHEMSGRSTARCERTPRFAYAARPASISRPRGVDCGCRQLGVVGRSITRLASLVGRVELLPAPTCCEGPTSVLGGCPQEKISSQVVHGTGRYGAAVTRYFCRVVRRF